jgi:predicted AAA+ superfamily ATPase
MNKELLKQVIIENQEFISNVKTFPREIFFEKTGNYVLTGPRRAGKTFVMFRVIKGLLASGTDSSEILYLNFEDERLMELTALHLNLIMEAFHELYDSKPYLFLDEIQNVAGWEKFARRLADQEHTVYITGSNAQMLSREIATTLGGRFIVREVFPLTFHEYLVANGIAPEQNWEYTAQRFDIRKQFNNFFYFCGFPEIMRFDDKRLWLRNLNNKIFFGDIVTRYNIRNDFALKLMIKKLAESTHDEISFNRIRHIIQSGNIKIGTATLIEYVRYLEESYLTFKLKNYLSKTGQRETVGKFYFVDNGILSLFLMHAETILLENIVANRLMRKHDDQVFYLKRKHEVDFYIPETKSFIQVAYDTSKPETENREIQSMLHLATIVEVEEMTVITFDNEKEVDVDGQKIRFIPVWKWLLK